MKRGHEFLLIIAVFSALVYFFSGIQLHQLSYFITPGDISQMYWNTCNFSDAVVHHKPVYFTFELLYPYGTGLFMHTYTIIFGTINLLIHDPVVSINLGILLNLVATATGFYYLSGIWIRQKYFRFLVGFISVFNGYILAKSGIHYNLVLLGTVPWTILLFLRSVSQQRLGITHKAKFAATILLLICSWFFDFYAVLYILSFLFLWFFYHRIFSKWIVNFTRIKLGFLIVTILGTHFISRYFFLHGTDRKGGIWESADIRQFLIPGAFGQYFSSNDTYTNSPVTENFVFCGYTLFILFALALFYYFRKPINNRKNGVFLFMSLVFFCIIFPDAKWDGNHLFFMPTSLIHYIPLLDNMRGPSRFVELFYIVATIFTLLQVSDQFYKNRKILPVFSFLFLVGFYLDHATIPKTKIPASFFEINKQDAAMLSGKKVLTIPFGIKDGLRGIGDFNAEDYVLSAKLDVQLFSGYVSRIPKETWDKIYADTTLERLIWFQQNSDSTVPAIFEREFSEWMQRNKVDVVRINGSENPYKNLMHSFESMALAGKGKLILSMNDHAYFLPQKNN